eukprot:3287693-Rhodomonas_salina.5
MCIRDSYTSVFHEPELKNQSQDCPSSKAAEWMLTKEKEIRTLWGLDTWEICYIPPGCVPLQGVWSYRVKSDSDGSISKYKARWCSRGDMQMPWEYNNTYSPTFRFAAVRTVFATAAQEGMELYHWDIQGAFCTSDVDKEIYMQPPTGYSLPPGKCLLLHKSLYGLRQSSTLFF